MQLPNTKPSSGFTLIELIVVIGMLTILLAITLVAINPAQQFASARNAQRRSDVNAILNAVHQYAANHNGSLPSGITTSEKTVGSDTAGDQLNLCGSLVPDYIADMPVDPSTGTKTPAGSNCTDSGAEYDTKYTIKSSGTSNRLVVTATADDGVETFSVTR